LDGNRKPPTFALAFEKQATAEAAGRESRKNFLRKIWQIRRKPLTLQKLSPRRREGFEKKSASTLKELQ